MRDETRWAWMFLLPCFLGLAVFTYLPIAASLGLSFSYWNLLGTPEWVGLANYQEILADPLFWKTFGNTALFVLMVGTLEVIVGLGLAVFLNRVLIGQGFFRTAYFLPYVTPMVSVALVWGWIYQPEYGVLNWLLTTLHVIGEPVAWLYNPNTALASIAVLQVWKSVGYNVILFLAGLQGISTSVYESAELDGATPWQTFWRVTLPMISPTMFFVLMITMINAFQTFDSVYLLTQGGPEHSTELLVYWMFKNAFEFYKVGPASAIAYVVFLVILTLTFIQWQLRKRWVLYEEDVT